MTTVNSRRGVVLVSVLIISAVVWVFIAGTLFAVRLRYDVAVAALHNSQARVVALTIAERANAHDWWSSPEEDVDTTDGSEGQCTWAVRKVEWTPTSMRYLVEATYGRAQVVVEGTAVR